MTRRLGWLGIGLLLGMISGSSYLVAQSAGDMNSTGAPSLVSGNPGPSRAESALENVNLYNGNLNVTTGLVNVGGRGSAGYSMLVPVQRRWNVDTNSTGAYPYSWNDAFSQPDYAATAYSPGTLVIRRAGSTTPVMNSTGCVIAGRYADFGPYITRLVWVAADGTETMLRDTNYDGQAQGSSITNCNAVTAYSPVSRGTVFASTDGSDMTFAADAAISDSVYPSTDDGQHQSGTLSLKNGTKYQIDSNGNVTNVADRNGNTVALSYPDDDTSVTDALGRSIVTQTGFYESGATFNNAAGTYEPSWDTVEYNGYGQTQRTIRINHNSLSAVAPNGVKTYQQLFPELAGADPTTFDPDVISSIVLPDGTSTYSFQYNEYGEVTQVTLPTGGIYRYYYQQTYSCPAGTGGGGGDGVISISDYSKYSIYRRMTERDELSDGVNISSKTTYHACAEANPDLNHSGRAETTVYVDRYDGSGNSLRHETHYFYGDPSAANSIPDATAYADWSDGIEFRTDTGDSAGAAARQSRQMVWQQRPCGVSVNTGTQEPCWFSDPQSDTAPTHDPQLCQVNTTLDGSTTSGQAAQYDQYNNQTNLYEFDFGAAPAVGASCPASPTGYLRNTRTTYQYGSTYVQANTHIWDLPATITVQNAQGGQIALRTLTYDGSGAQAASGITGNTPPAGPRGNATSDQQWWSTANANIGHQYVFDVAGNIVQDTDPNGNVTSLSYADSENTYAHLTGATLPAASGVAETLQMQYDYSTGFLTSFKDVNGGTTSYGYSASDGLDRLQSIGRPDGGTSHFSYPNLTRTTEADDLNTASDEATQTTLIYDGLRRLTQTWNLEGSGAGGQTYIATYQGYDGLGRASWVGNPVRTTAGIGTGSNCSALACTTTGYDSLNRVTSVTTPDGLAAQAGYTGNTASVTDQAQTMRSYTMDGLGRLTQVVENPGSAQVATTYCYDLLDNLAAVYQPLATTCQPSGYAGQVRTFNFDSLSRLEATTQPEGGATAFAYDPNGNLVWRQDSRGVETCTSFDGLNRPSARVYYEGSVAGGQTGQCGSIPSSAYDPQTTPVSYAYGTSGNGTGQLISVSNGVSVTQFTNFDALGRVLNSIQGTAGATYPFGYAYNLAGSLTNEGYPSGRGIAYAYDALDRPTQVSGTAAGQQAVSYMSGIAYAPQSAPQSYTYGNQLARSYTYNVRLQPQEMTDTAGGAALLDLQFGWDGGTATTHNNGSLRTQQIGTNAGTFAEGFGYDALNRLTSVTDNGGGANQRNYAYDAYGNAAVSGNTGTFPLSPLTPGAGTTFTNNQLPSSLATYDAAGNAIGLGSCTNCLAYDGENRQVAAALNGGTTTYGYDGAGNRVLKTAADGTATVYVYDALNQMIAEYTSAATPPTAPCQTCYVSWDQLGSTRLVTDAGGNVIARHDYLPFGEEIGAGNAGRPSGWGALDAVDQKFTGQERDDESHLDFFQARYYGSAQARFNSPDPMNAGADLYNPQSWNGYAYVMNTPLSAVDPDGLDSCTAQSCLSMGGSQQPGQTSDSGGGWLSGGGFTLWSSYSTPTLNLTRPIPLISANVQGNIWTYYSDGHNEISEPGIEHDYGADMIFLGAIRGSAALATRGVAAGLATAGGSVALAESPAEILQEVTTMVNTRLAANPSLARGVLTQAEFDAARSSARLIAPTYGKAVERLVRDQIEDSPVLRQIFQHISRPGAAVPDFEGIGSASGQTFDITTPGQVAAHLARPYGTGLNIITYSRPTGFVF